MRLIVLAALLLSSTLVRSAAAAEVSLQLGEPIGRYSLVVPATLRFVDSQGRPDDVSVSSHAPEDPDVSVTISDSAGVTAGPGCMSQTATLVTCAAHADVPISVSEPWFLGAGDDRIDLPAGGVVSGGDGDDVISSPRYLEVDGGRGDDALSGGGGVFVGGPGADRIQSTSDATLSYASSHSGVDVDLARGIGTRGDAKGDVLLGEFSRVEGSGFDDRITARALRGDPNLPGQEIYGEDGDDVLIGSPGRDALDGGRGDNVLDGKGNVDDLSASDARPGDHNRFLGGPGSDGIDASRGRDVIEGGPGLDGIGGVGPRDRVDVVGGGRDRVFCRNHIRSDERPRIDVDRRDAVHDCPRRAVHRRRR